jgi:type I restriction enzyme S subunit
VSWNSTTLGEVCRPRQWPVVAGKDMSESGYPVFGANGQIGWIDRITHHSETIAVGCRGSCGEVHIAPADSYINGNAMALDELNERLVDKMYLYRWLKYRGFADVISGSSQPQIIQQNIKRVDVPLPPLPEQRRIAEILDKADTLRRLRRQSLSRLSDLGQAIFHEMFDDWPSERPRWEMVELGKDMEFLTSGSRGWAEYYSDKGARFIRIQNVRRGYFEPNDMAFVNPPISAEARRTKVQPRDVLMSITADLGRAAVVPEDIGDAHINQHLAIVRNSTFNPHFLVAALTSQSGQLAIAKRDRSAVKSGLNFDDIRSLSIISPPRALQDEFEDRLNFTGILQNQYTKEAMKLDALFASLQHRAFRGEL